MKYYVIKHLTLLKFQNMMDIKEVFLQWFMHFLMKSLLPQTKGTYINFDLVSENQYPSDLARIAKVSDRM